MAVRALRQSEISLVQFLLRQSGLEAELLALRVQTMADGGMGSLAFAPVDGSRKFGATAAVCEFTDVDGQSVSAALNLDTNGQLLELDVWRVDFAPLLRWPAADTIAALPSNNSSERTRVPRAAQFGR